MPPGGKPPAARWKWDGLKYAAGTGTGLATAKDLSQKDFLRQKREGA